MRTHRHAIPARALAGALIVLVSGFFSGGGISTQAATAQTPLPLISRNVPAYTNDDCGGSGPAGMANDGNYDTQWHACNVPPSNLSPAWLAYDLSAVPAANRAQVLVAWYNDPTTLPYDHTFVGVHPCCVWVPADLPNTYTIEANPAPGGVVPTAGWVTLASVSGNHFHSRQHALNLTGYQWVRLSVTASDGSSGNVGVRLNLDVHDASAGLSDDWIFYGDSITEGAMPHNTYANAGGTSTWAQLINAANPSYFPAFEAGAIGGTLSQDGVNHINTWLALFAGHYVGVAYGTNDAGFNVPPATFHDNYVTMIQAIFAAGKVPVIPHIPWGCTTTIQGNVPGLNQQIDALYTAYPQIVRGPDLWAFFQANQGLISSDCVHPTAQGYVAMRKQWASAMLARVYNTSGTNPTPTPKPTPTPSAPPPGTLISDVTVPEAQPGTIGPSVAFDGQFLYYTSWFTDGGAILHRIDVPPAGSLSGATGHTDIPIVGASVMDISYDASRDMFWAAGGDGVSIYLLAKTGRATLQFVVDPATGRPGNCKIVEGCHSEINGLAYDGTDDTIWYSPDASYRIYHYQTYGDALASALPVSATPYVDVDVAPNDMAPQCGYNNSAGVVVGGTHLFLTAGGCAYFFEYTKTGTKVGFYQYTPNPSQHSPEDLECDNLSYPTQPVVWIRDGYTGHIRAFAVASGTCVYGGGFTLPPGARMKGSFEAPASTPADATADVNISLHCAASVTPNRLEASWKDAAGKTHRFHLLSETDAACSDDPTITPNPSNASFDTLGGHGTGAYDGTTGASADWQFKDGGTANLACLRLSDPTGILVLYVGTGSSADCTTPPSHGVAISEGDFQASD